MNGKPDFLCVGLPKSGTTTLHYVLGCHEEIAMPPVKEIKFFLQDRLGLTGSRLACLAGGDWARKQDRTFLFKGLAALAAGKLDSYERGALLRYFSPGTPDAAWYRGLFHDAKISGDITPNYFWLDAAECARIAADWPWLKIILMLRNPLDLHRSYYRMVIEKEGDAALAPDAVERTIADKKRHIGRYRDLAGRWQAAFGDERVFIGYFDDLARAPRDFFTQLCGFLGVGSDVDATPRLRDNVAVAAHPTQAMALPADLEVRLVELAAFNLEGFEAVDAERAASWRAEIETARIVAAQGV